MTGMIAWACALPGIDPALMRPWSRACGVDRNGFARPHRADGLPLSSAKFTRTRRRARRALMTRSSAWRSPEQFACAAGACRATGVLAEFRRREDDDDAHCMCDHDRARRGVGR